jgi:hypothetical protein
VSLKSKFSEINRTLRFQSTERVNDFIEEEILYFGESSNSDVQTLVDNLDKEIRIQLIGLFKNSQPTIILNGLNLNENNYHRTILVISQLIEQVKVASKLSKLNFTLRVNIEHSVAQVSLEYLYLYKVKRIVRSEIIKLLESGLTVTEKRKDKNIYVLNIDKIVNLDDVKNVTRSIRPVRGIHEQMAN